MRATGDHNIGIIFAAIAFQAAFHLRDQPRLLLRAGEDLAQPGCVAILFRHELRNARAGGGIDVLISRDVQSFSARVFNPRQHFICLSPRHRTGEFDVRYFGADARFACNAKDLRQRVENVAAFPTHMAGIDSVELRRHFSQIDDLLSLCVNPGQIDQPSGKTHRPVLHRLFDQVLHLCHLPGSRRAGEGTTHGLLPY